VTPAFTRACRVVFAAAWFERDKAGGATGMTTTVPGDDSLDDSLKGLPVASGSTNGTGSGVNASDQSRADPTTHAAATNTAAIRRVPTATSSRLGRTTSKQVSTRRTG
jgi:hypothetical protein